ncbi:MAG: hypothetical protein ACKVPY_14310 [Paracoccaceae bacterium]
MDWSAAIDGYCERTGPGLWAEPLNAATNLAFLIAAAFAWRAARGVPVARALAGLLAAIGVGSGLFHTLAVGWAAVADVAPIGAFILAYVWAVNRRLVGVRPAAAAAVTALYLPVHAALAWALAEVPVVGVSAGYLPVPLAILGYAAALGRRLPATARGLAAGAGMLVVSIVLRSLDGPLCGVWPMGTHFLWHLLNAAMLWWMIRVLVRHEADLRPAAGSAS